MPTAELKAPSGTGPDPAGTATIGRELHEIRLRHRERRIHQVMLQLRARVEAHAIRGDAVPRPLGQALESFAGELAEVRRALAAQRRASLDRWPHLGRG